MRNSLVHEIASESSTGVDISEQMQKLMQLVGRWEGQGKGRFPTIEPFLYHEVLEFRFRQGTSYITYEQTAELIDANAAVIEQSHWEAGIIRPREDGRITMSSAHDSMRVEVLRGFLDADNEGNLELQLESVLHGNDPRMESASRVFTLQKAELSYVMSMATQNVSEPTVHLSATLTRTSQ